MISETKDGLNNIKPMAQECAQRGEHKKRMRTYIRQIISTTYPNRKDNYSTTFTDKLRMGQSYIAKSIILVLQGVEWEKVNKLGDMINHFILKKYWM